MSADRLGLMSKGMRPTLSAKAVSLNIPSADGTFRANAVPKIHTTCAIFRTSCVYMLKTYKFWLQLVCHVCTGPTAPRMLTRMPTRLTVPEPGPDGRQPSQMSPLGKKPPSCAHISLQASAGQPTIGQAPAAATVVESRYGLMSVVTNSTLKSAFHGAASPKQLGCLCCV